MPPQKRSKKNGPTEIKTMEILTLQNLRTSLKDRNGEPERGSEWEPI
jgi:hypothetical protein